MCRRRVRIPNTNCTKKKKELFQIFIIVMFILFSIISYFFFFHFVIFIFLSNFSYYFLSLLFLYILSLICYYSFTLFFNNSVESGLVHPNNRTEIEYRIVIPYSNPLFLPNINIEIFFD